MKNSIKMTLFIFVFVACVAIGTNANATFFSGTATGEWSNVLSTDSYDKFSISNKDDQNKKDATFNWGVGGNKPPATKFDNQFTFDGVGSDKSWDAGWETNTDDDLAFLLGDFTYRNGSTTNSKGIEGVDLDIGIVFSDPAGITSFVFSNSFSIINTPNDYNPLSNPKNNDTVSFLSTTGNTFSYAGTDYTLDILGFSQDGKTFAFNFDSPEGATASAGLYGQITKTGGGGAQVPEPATIFLLGSGLLGLFGYRKKFWKPKN